MTTEAIESIERNLQKARAIVEFANAIERLRTNKDFKKVFIDGYFKDEALRLVHLKADPAMQTPTSQASIISQLDAIGACNQFLSIAVRQAAIAGKQIEDDEAALAEILEEGLNDAV